MRHRRGMMTRVVRGGELHIGDSIEVVQQLREVADMAPTSP